MRKWEWWFQCSFRRRWMFVVTGPLYNVKYEVLLIHRICHLLFKSNLNAKNLTSPKMQRWQLWLLLTSSETFLFLFRGAKPNKTTLCFLFVVDTSWYNGLCVGDGRLQPRPCSHLYAVIHKKLEHHTVKDFHLNKKLNLVNLCKQILLELVVRMFSKQLASVSVW